MAAPARDSDEPLSPTGRLLATEQMNQVILCAMGLERPPDVGLVKDHILGTFLQHPRMRSLMIRDANGVERWQMMDHVDVDRHLIVVDRPVSAEDNDDDAVNEYLADMTTGPGLSLDKPLWEIHILTFHRCIVFRIHHAVGDGISLMSLLLITCRKVGDPTALPEIPSLTSYKNKENIIPLWQRVVGFFGMVWFTFISIVEFLVRLACVPDRKTTISGGDGVDLWLRKLATARFWLDDMKAVKRAVVDATINDVLFGVISYGLSKYLDLRTPNALREGQQITGLAMVNLRKVPGLQEVSELMKRNSQTRWGNKIGLILLPVEYHKSNTRSDPLQCVKRAKSMLDRKKKSLEAPFSCGLCYLVTSYLGSKVASFLHYRLFCHTSFLISNILGPQEEIAFGDNRVTYIRENASSLPHALTMHMLSYAGRAEMQISVAKDIISDPEFLAKCFEEALLEMKEAAAK